MPRLIVDLSIAMIGKNPYPLGFFQTDEQGVITITLKQVRESIAQIQDQSLMDYAPLDLNTQPEFEVQITADPKRSLRGRLGALRVFYPEAALALERMLREASNPDDWGHLWVAQVGKTTARLVLDFPSTVRENRSEAMSHS
ncbi:MAG: hypothetical protein ABI353_24200 [Isosphaeraceae bacterium]